MRSAFAWRWANRKASAGRVVVEGLTLAAIAVAAGLPRSFLRIGPSA